VVAGFLCSPGLCESSQIVNSHHENSKPGLTIEGLLSGNERVNAPPQVNPFAKAQREGKPQKQTELI
jgi:hypothetical protein